MKELGALVISLAFALSACGDDGGANLTAACEGQVELSRGLDATVGVLEAEGGGRGPPPEGGGPPPERGEPSSELVRRLRDHYDEKLGPAVAKLKANAPDEIKDDVESYRQELWIA